jgi:predicted acylesterase/phospholipase RssA
VILASASIPAAFPPVIIDVEADGNRYDEMHVDGGTVSQIFVTPANVKWSVVARNFDIKGTPRLFLIRNSSFDPHWETANQKIINVAGKSISLLIKTQGIGDINRIYAASKKNGIDFNLASIPW